MFKSWAASRAASANCRPAFLLWFVIIHCPEKGTRPPKEWLWAYTKATILDKTTWENVFNNVHYLTQQNYFQINGFTQRKPPPPVQSCFLQMLRRPAFFWNPTTLLPGRGGGGKNRSATKFRKNAPQVCNFLNSFVQDCRLKMALSRFASFVFTPKKITLAKNAEQTMNQFILHAGASVNIWYLSVSFSWADLNSFRIISI